MNWGDRLWRDGEESAEPLSRRELLARGAAATIRLGIGAMAMGACKDERPRVRWREYGPLVRDPANVIDLPRGFRYRVLSAGSPASLVASR
jgi:hypothetical protein